jgi:S-DNA-T family DNA segregation ATPase FtsK/SpoIIIE
LNRYKLTVSGRNIYKEVELSPEAETIKIGTTGGCEIRLRKELFFEHFELTLSKLNNAWQLFCSDRVYISTGDVRKLLTKTLEHGNELVIRYRISDSDVVKIGFSIDFEYTSKNYERLVDISNVQRFTIGSREECNIKLEGEFVNGDLVELSKAEDGLHLLEKSTKYGVYHNGKRIKGSGLIRDFDFISIAGYSFYYRQGTLFTGKNDSISFNGLSFADINPKGSGAEYPHFNRSTRLIAQIPNEPITILNPPKKPQKQKVNIIISLLPALLMVGMALIMSRSISGGGFLIFSGLSMGVGVLSSLISLITGSRDFKKENKLRKQKYEAYISEKRRELTALRDNERELLEHRYYNTDTLLQMTEGFSGDLFDRCSEDEDFLSIRIGSGEVEALRKVDFKHREAIDKDDELEALPEQLACEFKYIPNAAVVIPAAQANAIGLVGSNMRLYSMFKILLLDLAIRHYYKDVSIFVISNEASSQLLNWIRLLPHLQNEALNSRSIVCDNESKTLLFDYLFKELSLREQEETVYPHCVVLVCDDMGLRSHPLSRYIEKAAEYGFTFIFFKNRKEELPLGCSELIFLSDDSESGILAKSSDAGKSTAFSYNSISDEAALKAVTRLAPVYCEELSLEHSLTKSISLFELLKVYSADDLDLGRHWASSHAEKSMAVPLGVRSNGTAVLLDLHEKAHGPHGLVAGTTGSGKSELLQSYILSAASLFHPYELSFLIIDFKGGGMVNQFKNLPHLVGAITNIEGKEIERSLLSIKAELQKRQSLFAKAEVNHIDKYIARYKAGELNEPLPHLVLIVDEFAELKATQPEFMKELISAARIGRSLGVHLILATQKPSGQVDDQIWSNSRFKLCLKVQNKDDSNEVLHSPLAAEILEPGRAYFQVGNNEVFELFQSAYSGCSDRVDDNGKIKEFALCSVDFAGRRRVIYSKTPDKQSGDSATQLEAIVEHISAYCKKQGIAPLAGICMPPLPDVLEYPAEGEAENKIISIGVYDNPASQYQGPAELDVFTRNAIIIGSAQYGKTNILQSVIRSLATKYSPNEVNIYILDFGSMVLKGFEALHHVGGVVSYGEDEKLKNLFKLLTAQLAIRKEKLLSAGVSSFAAYIDAGYTDLPHIVLMIDNMTALQELYLEDNEALLLLCREGLAVGLSVLMANSQTTGISYRYISNFSTVIALHCNDTAEYGNLFDYCRIRPKAVRGRCIMEIDKQIYECQSYLAFSGEKEIDRARSMRSFIDEVNARHPHSRAGIIPVIPPLLTDTYVDEQFSHLLTRPYQLAAGLNYSTVEPFILDISTLGTLGITGKESFGKGNFVRRLLYSFNRLNDLNPVEVTIIDDVSKKFQSLQGLGCVKSYTSDAQAVRSVIPAWEQELQRRYALLTEGNEEELNAAPLLLLILQNNDVAEIIGEDAELNESYNAISSAKLRTLKACIIFSNYENVSLSYMAPEPIKRLKDARRFLVFEDLDNLRVLDMPLEVMRRFKKPLETGDAYFIKESEIIKLKMTLNTKTF